MYNLHTLTVIKSTNVISDDALFHTNNALDENCDSDNGVSGNVADLL